MKPFQAYKKNALTGWTRIEMLLAIYDGTIQAMDDGVDALNRGDAGEVVKLRLRTSQLLLLILDGIDLNSGEIAKSIRDLCVYCVEQITSDSAASWAHAREILATVREGFEGVREEAIRLEAAGVIPDLSVSGNSVVHA